MYLSSPGAVPGSRSHFKEDFEEDGYLLFGRLHGKMTGLP